MHRLDSIQSVSLITTHLLNELHGLIPVDGAYGANFLVVEQHTVEFVRGGQHLRSEGGRDELRRTRQLVNHAWLMISAT